MSALLQAEQWYLFKVLRVEKITGRTPSHIVCLECVKGPCVGQKMGEKFFLSDKAISRLEVLIHRCGIERPIKTLNDLTGSLWVDLLGRKFWARLKKNEWNGQEYLGIDGWCMRAEDDPPEEAAEPVDYAAQDAWDVAMDGL